MRLKVIYVVFRKEAADISRDRRALVISVLIPLVLFPLSFFALNVNIKKTSRSLDRGIPAYVNVSDSGICVCITEDGRVVQAESADPAADLASGKIAAIIEDGPYCGSRVKSVRITSDNTSQFSTAACDIIHGKILGCVAPDPHSGRGVPPVEVSRHTLADAKKGAGVLMLQLLIPMLILVFSATAPMAVAADLFAGEKERGTLEHLLSVPVSGGELVAGKFIAAMCAGIAGVISFMSGIALSYIISPDLFGAAGIIISLSPVSVLWAVLFSMLIVMTFTAAEFALSVFSRSAREAQILFIPVIIIAMACGHTAAITDVKRISLIFRHLPVINSGLILKELVTGIFSWDFMALAAFWSMALTGLFLYMCRSMLAGEKYIFRA